jgi:hypothetical protein
MVIDPCLKVKPAFEIENRYSTISCRIQSEQIAAISLDAGIGCNRDATKAPGINPIARNLNQESSREPGT